MKTIVVAVLFLVPGALAMSEDKKAEKPFETLKKEDKFSLDEKVTVRISNDKGKTFPTVKESVPANRFKADKSPRNFYVQFGGKTGIPIKPPAGSEVVDDAGYVYVVTETSPQAIDGKYLLRVERKDEKKP